MRARRLEVPAPLDGLAPDGIPPTHCACNGHLPRGRRSFAREEEPLTTPDRFLRRAPRIRAALIALLAVSFPLASEPARAYGSVVFFGDSLTDTGNVCAGIASTGNGFAAGRCSNGPVWADHFVAGLGLGTEATSSASGGSNHASGGSRSQNFATQIDDYTAAGGGVADPDALHVVWLGGNDVLFEVILNSSGPDAMQQAAARIGAGIQSLAAAGAQHFLVANAPDVGLVYGNPALNPPIGNMSVPFDEASRDVLTDLSIEFNAALEDVLSGIAVDTLLTVDVFGSFGEIIGDPEAFGFSAGAVDGASQSRPFPIACLADPACAADPQGAVADGFLIFDSVHPTTALHGLIADQALAAVVPEPSTASCVALGLVVLSLRRRR